MSCDTVSMLYLRGVSVGLLQFKLKIEYETTTYQESHPRAILGLEQIPRRVKTNAYDYPTAKF